LFAAEPCSLRVGSAGVAPVPGHAHEFRFTMGFLTGRIAQAGVHVDRIVGKRIALRFASTVFPSPPLRAFWAGDRVDRMLTVLPGVSRLAELALVRATRLDSRR